MSSAKAAGEIEDYSEPILAGKGPSDYERYLRTDELVLLPYFPELWAIRNRLTSRAIAEGAG